MKSFRIFLFLLPFAYFPWANQQFELIKFVWLLIVGVGIWGLEKAYRIWRYGEVDLSVLKSRKWWWILLGIYGLYLGIQTTFFALSPEISFWGSYQRHGGGFLFLALLVLLFLLVTHPWTKDDKEKLFTTLIASATGVSLLAIVQKLGYMIIPYLPYKETFASFFAPATDLSFTMGRAFATMGHPNFLGQFLLMTIVLTGGYILMRKVLKAPYYVVALLLQIAALITTWNRASILTLLGVAAVYGVYLLYRKHASQVMKAVLVAASIIALGLLTWTFFHVDTRSADTRIKLYPAVMDMISHQPLIGYGLDSFGYAFSAYFPKGIGETENFLDLPDKAHNELLDIIAEQGIIGLILLITLAVQLVLYIYKAKKQDTMVLVAAVALIANEVTNLAGFSVVTHRVVATVLLAYIVSSVFGNKQHKPQRPPMLAVTTGFVALIFMSLGFRFLLADIAYAQYKATSSSELYDLSLRVSPFPYEYVLFGPIDASADARSLFPKVLKTNPFDIYSQFLEATAAKAEGKSGEAKEALLTAERFCPNCPEVAYRQAMLAYEVNDSAYFLNRAEKYMALLPQFVFENKQQITDPVVKERQRIFLKEQKEAIKRILLNKETISPLTPQELVLKTNILD